MEFRDMDFLVQHPAYALLYIFTLLPSVHWREITFVYTDAEKRGIKNKLGWGALALLMGPWMMPIYNAKTQRETPEGYLVDESLTKHKTRVVFMIVFIILGPVLAFMFYPQLAVLWHALFPPIQ